MREFFPKLFMAERKSGRYNAIRGGFRRDEAFVNSSVACEHSDDFDEVNCFCLPESHRAINLGRKNGTRG